MQLLAGDIGGTKTILRLVETAESQTAFQTLKQAKYNMVKIQIYTIIIHQYKYKYNYNVQRSGT